MSNFLPVIPNVKRFPLLLLVGLAVGLMGTPVAQAEEDSKFVLTGYVSTQGGIFVDPESSDSEWWNFSDSNIVMGPDGKPLLDSGGNPYSEYQHADVQPSLESGLPNNKFREFPTKHGDKFLKPSMLRSTIFLEADWTPWDKVNIHAIFRGVRSLQLAVDDDAQPPVPGDVVNKREWVQDNYYTENDLRELYVSFEATDWWYFRVGKQQVSWGEIGQYRLLDVVNPVDSTWHFGPFESFEDQRIPNYMLNTNIEISAMQGSLDLLWVPMLDDPKDLVNPPLTFVGAWGLPPSPVQDDKGIASEKIARKLFEYPQRRWEDSRAGARWKGSLGAGTFNYTLMYFYGHQYTPPVPKYYVARAPIPYTDANGIYQARPDEGTDVYIYYPRQQVFGFSTEYAFDNPLGVVMRVEAAMTPWRTFSTNSLQTTALQHVRESQGLEPVPELDKDDHREPYTGKKGVDAAAAKTYFRSHEKHVVNYAVQLMRPTMIRWLNPSSSVLLVLQVMHSVVLDFDRTEQLIDIPGYDSSVTKEHDVKIVAVATSKYLSGMVVPKIVAIYAPPRAAIIFGTLSLAFGNHWRMRLMASTFISDNPYRGIGLFRDRDEVNLSVMYQF